MLKPLFAAFFLLAAAVNTQAAEPGRPDDNFMLVLREAFGASKQDFGLVPIGPGTVGTPDGKSIPLNHAWYRLIGDLQVRFVEDGEHLMRNYQAEEFEAFGLTPEQAVDLAIANIRKRYGEPKATPWEQGILQVSGESPDVDSSYFLDRAFWDDQLARHPDGLVVGVPARGGLIFAPVSDARAVAVLEENIAALYEDSGRMQVSSALYLYKDGAWKVHREPLRQP